MMSCLELAGGLLYRGCCDRSPKSCKQLARRIIMAS
jgi:hypothetical protein